MKNNPSSYSVLVSKALRCLNAAAIPFFVVLGALNFYYFTDVLSMSLFPYISYFHVAALVFLDHFAFGGICTKDSIEIGFLKTSIGGFDLIIGAVRFDTMIKIISTFVVMIAPMCFNALINGIEIDVKYILQMLMVFAMTSVLELFSVIFARHISALQLKMLYVSIVGFVLAIGLMILNNAVGYGVIAEPVIIAIIVVALAVMAFEVWFITYDIRKILKNSFYDCKVRK